MSSKPWDIYAEQLLPLGYGYPLWIPEPSQTTSPLTQNSTTSREIFIGDVGWVSDGEFRALFNSMKDANDPVNQEMKVPTDFAVFSPSNILIGRSNLITASMVFSRNITASETQAELAAVA